MTHMLTRSLKAVALAAGVSLAALAQAAAAQIDVTIITASDMDTMGENDGRGGVARLAAVVKSERDDKDNVVFVFPGDLLSPSILAGFDRGQHMIDLLNVVPPDMLTPGNHEFDFGADVFRERMREAKFPILGTNIRENGQPIEPMVDTIVKEFKGEEETVKIGFLGVTTTDTAITSSPGPISFLPVNETVAAAAAKLREEGADIIVAAVHTHSAVDYELVNNSDVDIVLSGHDHVLNVYFDGRKALVESKEEAEYVTMMDLAIEVGESRGERRVSWWPNFRIQDTKDVEPLPAVAEKVAAYENTLSEELDVELGKTDVELDTRRISVRTGETAFGNLVADAMRQAVSADIAFTNGGGIRGNKQYEAGTTLTRRDVLTELPFGNGTVLIELTGRQVLEALEHGYRQVPEATGSFLQVSGLKATVDTAKPAGARVSDVAVNGEPLDMDRTYKVATNDFMARGGDGYDMLTDAKQLIDKDSAKLMASDVMVFVRERGVPTGIDGRLTFK